MTQEEQARIEYPSKQMGVEIVRDAFCKGAEWGYKRAVNKACKWLLANAHLYIYATTKEKRALMFDNFKSIMKE